MIRKIIILLSIFILVSCDNAAKFKTEKTPVVTNEDGIQVEAEVFPNRVLDGQQVELKIKLATPVISDQVINYEVLDGAGEPAIDFFLNPTGTTTIPAGTDSTSAFMTTLPSSVITGTEEFVVNITGVGIKPYRVGKIEVQSSLENPPIIDTVSIVSVENNGFNI